MICPHCEQDPGEQFDLRQSGPSNPEFGGSMGVKVMRVCAKCHEIIGPAQEPAPAAPKPTMDQARAQVTAEDLDIGGITSLGGMAAMLGQPAPSAPPEPPIVVPVEPPSADAIEADARRRLEFVRAEIEKLRGYEDEETRLTAMLDALAPASGERAVS